MDLAKMSEKVKVFQRRATQKVMQQMGLAEKTMDDFNDHASQTFTALGSFTSQLKATIQAADSTIEKSCTAQTHLAGQVQSYLHSELSGDTDLPPGELYDFFNASSTPDAQMHAVLLQEVAEKFYSSCSEIGNQFLRSLVNRLDDAIIKPISKDEEFNVITKDLVEERKKATLDYDSYRRQASNSSSPMEQEKNENKMRLAKEKLDNASRRLAEHYQARNAIRCKLLVHGILTAMQQYHIFYAAAADAMAETANAIRPLLDVYQMNENQLISTVSLENLKSSGNKLTKGASEAIFDEYNPGRPPKPTPPAKPSSSHSAHRHASPQPPKELDQMMATSLAGMKQPATAPGPSRPSAPMNQQKTPPPTQGSPTGSNNGQSQAQTSPLNGSGGNNSNGLNSSGNQGDPPPVKPTLVEDPFADDWGSSSGGAAAPSGNADFLDLGGLHPSVPPSTSPPPVAPPTTSGSGSIFGDDLFNLGGSNPLQPNLSAPFTPPLQPNPVFTPPLQPSKATNSPTPGKSGAQPNPFPPSFGVTPQPPPKPTYSQAKPTPQFTQQPFGFDMFGGPPSQPPNFPGHPPPPPTNSYVTPSQVQEQEERHDLNPAITSKIQNWAERGGRQNNLRSLLSTMHEVIWVDSGWDAMSLAELVTTPQVKKAYLRANKIVHPDKVQTGTVEQKLIAQRLFEALRVSYEKFTQENQ